MKNKKLVLTSILAAVIIISAGCGKKADTTPSSIDPKDATVVTDAANNKDAKTPESIDPKDATVVTDAANPDEVFEAQGQITEIKDFQFTLKTDGGDIAFSFDEKEKPEGLDKVKDGDMVNVKFTGEINPVEPFKGKVLSVSPYKE